MQKITIIQKGILLAKPAKPVLILQDKPMTNIPTSAMPKKIVNFSLNFIFIPNHLLILSLLTYLSFKSNLTGNKG